jgi:hypothetical protein
LFTEATCKQITKILYYVYFLALNRSQEHLCLIYCCKPKTLCSIFTTYLLHKYKTVIFSLGRVYQILIFHGMISTHLQLHPQGGHRGVQFFESVNLTSPVWEVNEVKKSNQLWVASTFWPWTTYKEGFRFINWCRPKKISKFLLLEV